ncbi:IS110 family transposase [Paenibacillus lycopersici]|uniref:IS110 family transposase n=1 Tax=Paenibacillus lycopersici TaxID=2704462 RepID=A0A6C0G2S4_9BACL|nr:IS110 family transposase [Paenibacillus lycopersici]QHT60880.1 IS110 family transposase [Paenibacillus lycopersici]QHT62665.1 IS110 family transposase [Paenibacillus lycopersici]
MKFNASNAINQRIEKITPQHLIVGIDIAKETHVAAAVNFRGIQQGRKLVFSNHADGLERLLRWVQDLQRAYGFTEVIFGAESTGHYFLNVAFALRKRGLTVVLVNPLTTKRNKENRDNKPSKNDAKDAVTIGDVVSRGYYTEWVVHDPVYRQLHALVNEREAMSDALTVIDNQLQTAIDQVFPEFWSVFKHWDGSRARATLRSFPLPADILANTLPELIEGWRTSGLKRAGGTTGIQIASQLLLAAGRSIGVTEAAELGRRIQRLLARYEHLLAQQAEVDVEIAALLERLPPAVLRPLQEVGLSPWFMAVILANTGDLRRYTHGQQLLALAGLNLAERSSGTCKGQVKLAKRGRRQLRKYLYLAVMMLLCNHAGFKRWHTYNIKTLRQKGIHSVLKLVGKLCRILVALAHSGEAFQEQKAAPLRNAT